jgi:hypothetical protein
MAGSSRAHRNERVLGEDDARPDAPQDLYSEMIAPESPWDTADGMRMTPLEDGGLEIMLDGAPIEEAAPQQPPEHAENLALRMTSSDLNRIGQQVIEWVEADEESRKPWWDRLEQGLQKAGIIDQREPSKDLSIAGASRVVHPMLVEAAVQFQARALEELFPSSGPVKCVPLGTRITKELQEQADRVADFMNWQIVTLDDSYFWDVDQMLFYLPFSGSAFKKSYFDRMRKRLYSRFIKADNIIVPYGAQTNEEPRQTHRFTLSHNELLKMQRRKLYVDVAISVPAPKQETTLSDKADDAEPSSMIFESDHEMVECHCEIIVPGIDQGGEYADIAWPYTVTVERESGQVMAIYRNWKEADRDRNRRRWFTHYRYLPGLGYYGFGLFHAIGGLSEAATGTLRAFLDAAGFANFQGGFKSKDVSMKNGEIVLEMGKWKDVDCSAEELTKGFYTPPFKEPSASMPAVLGLLTEAGQRFASTTEAMVGEGTNNVPVGTTVARIEQGSKVYTGIHRRLHRAAGEEFKLRAELNGEHIPVEGYPYVHGRSSKTALAQDFDDRVDVSPVSDPNIFSSTQRIAISQASLQLAQSAPGLYDQYEAHKRMHQALKTPDLESLLIDPDDIQPKDPVSEGQLVLHGKPFRAFLQQAHDAHLIVHMNQVQQFQGTPTGKQIVPVLVAHMAEHIALKYRLEMGAMLGVQLPDPSAKDAQPVPPEIENAIAVRAAQAIQMMQAQIAAQQAQQVDPAAAQAQADSQRKDKLVEADIARKDKIAEAEQRRKDAAFQAEQQQEQEARQLEAAQAVIDQNGVTGVDPRMLVQASQELKLDLQRTLEVIMRTRAAGQQQNQPRAPLVEVQTS